MSLFGLEMFEVLVVASVMAGVAIRQMIGGPSLRRRTPLLLKVWAFVVPLYWEYLCFNLACPNSGISSASYHPARSAACSIIN